jgi:molybdenum cofactor cytidylyltransferase
VSRGIVGILLAAGAGRRFGADKLVHRLDDGTPMALASARRLTAVLDDVVAVVADSRSEVAKLLDGAGLSTVVNPLAGAGMGTSIACGVAARPGAQAWIIALGDMPYVPESAVRAVVERLSGGADIVAPHYRGQRGHPVGFSRRHAPALMRLRGDEGARAVLTQHRQSLELIEVQDPGVVLDIDY